MTSLFYVPLAAPSKCEEIQGVKILTLFGGFCCVGLTNPIGSWCLERLTFPVVRACLGRFHLKMETESSLPNVVLNLRMMDNI
jgi:hypothetical protein